MNLYSATIIFYVWLRPLIFITFNVLYSWRDFYFLRLAHFNLILCYDTFQDSPFYNNMQLFSFSTSDNQQAGLQIKGALISNYHSRIKQNKKVFFSHRNRQQDSTSSKMLTQGGYYKCILFAYGLSFFLCFPYALNWGPCFY